MFTAIIIGILKFLGLTLGSAMAVFLIIGLTAIAKGKATTIRMGKGYLAVGFAIAIAYNLIKWSL